MIQKPAPAIAYGEALEQAIAAMEAGRHAQALAPLRAALTLDRNEPVGLLTLGTLYLHTGSAARAAAGFAQAGTLAPGDPLVQWGAALAALARGERNLAARFDALPAEVLPAAPTLALYSRLLAGGSGGGDAAAAVAAALAAVTEAEPDPLRLELAAFAALRGGDGARGEALLRALLARPGMGQLAEQRAFVLLFEPNLPAQGGAPALPTAIGFPATSGGTLSGLVTLSAGGAPVPAGAAYVCYTVDGGAFSATTNRAPFTLDWNTARVPNGLHALRTTIYGADGRVLRDATRTVRISNANAPRTVRLTPEQARLMRDRLIALLMPRPSRKAAHFALAERAAARGDGNAALQHIEAVVAIDPLFRNARASLRGYNLQVLGPREGIWRARTNEKIVALTFDDGPNPLPARTPALLDALKAGNARATFFVVGARAEQSPDLLRRMADEQHEVANHSYSHQNLTLLTPTAVERELCRTSVVIRQATGRRPRFYRPPGGNGNGTVRSAAEALGMAGAFWTVDGVRHEDAASSRAALTRYVLENTRPGAIILLHNAPPVTVAAVPDIVRGLRARGYTLVTMSELVLRARGQAAAAPVAARSRKVRTPGRGSNPPGA